MSSKDVSFSQISPSNFRCGEVLGGTDGEQYVVTDAIGQPDSDEEYAVIVKLSPDERVKPEFLDGTVAF